MKSARPFMRTLLVSLALVATTQPVNAQSLADDPDLVRKELTEVNNAWSKVRLGYDSVAAGAMLTADFYVQLRDRRVTRDEFITLVSTRSPAVTLVRFDNPILTIIKGETPDEYVALVLEKLEYQRHAADGTESTQYALWITRDGFRRVAPGQWRLMYSHEVMRESWANGRRPPMPDWNAR